MKQLYQHNDKFYIIHKKISISSFTHKNGKIELDMVKECMETLYKVDHVLRNETHFMFVETIQDAEIIEENQELVEEAHSGHSA
jgi:hypothetical protein